MAHRAVPDTEGPQRCTPFTAAVSVDSVTAEGIVTSTIVDGDEPIFAGHYPGFPIFPGVCLVECAHRSVLLAAAGSRAPLLELEAVESARFLLPVFPGDRVVTDVRIERAEGTWRCRSSLSTRSGKAAEVRLRYRMGNGT